MALVITNPTHVPPGGAFVAKCDQSGAVFRHHTMDGVWLKYNEHCRANGYPEVNERQITELICRDTKANICQDSDAPTFGQMLVNFAHDMYEWARAGFPASREVAEQRLTICQAIN